MVDLTACTVTCCRLGPCDLDPDQTGLEATLRPPNPDRARAPGVLRMDVDGHPCRLENAVFIGRVYASLSPLGDLLTGEV